MPRSNITLRDWCITNNIDLIQFLLNKADADNYSYSSHCKVYWKYSKEHIFSRAIMNMTSRKKFTCSICSGKVILIGYNDLATTRPDLAEEWDYDKNDILPTEVTAGAFKDVWWKCENNHSWKARISSRDYRNGCPYCNGKSRTSLPEQIVYYYCKKYFSDTMNMYSINGVSYDIYIPSRKIVIEYDGSAWHSNKDTNYKFITASEAGLTLYKISFFWGRFKYTRYSLLFSVNYILSMKPTRFRNNFERFKDKYFICMNESYNFIIDELNKIFNLSLSMEKIHLLLNNFLSRLERI